MLGRVLRFLLLRFLPRRLLPLLALIELIRFVRRVRTRDSRVVDRRNTVVRSRVADRNR